VGIFRNGDPGYSSHAKEVRLLGYVCQDSSVLCPPNIWISFSKIREVKVPGRSPCFLEDELPPPEFRKGHPKTLTRGYSFRVRIIIWKRGLT
jgi:hypothetical protein